MNDYKTNVVSKTSSQGTEYKVYQNMFEFGTHGNNLRRYPATYLNNADEVNAGGIDPSSAHVLFTLDGKGTTFDGADKTMTVPFKSNQSLARNIQAFIKAIANPFEWTVTVTRVPTGGQYFEYSSVTTDYYAWYQVDGAGVDPDPEGPSRTGVMVAIGSGDSFKTIANKTATAIDSMSFNLPDSTTDLVAMNGTEADWYIHM